MTGRAVAGFDGEYRRIEVEGSRRSRGDADESRCRGLWPRPSRSVSFFFFGGWRMGSYVSVTCRDDPKTVAVK